MRMRWMIMIIERQVVSRSRKARQRMICETKGEKMRKIIKR